MHVACPWTSTCMHTHMHIDTQCGLVWFDFCFVFRSSRVLSIYYTLKISLTLSLRSLAQFWEFYGCWAGGQRGYQFAQDHSTSANSRLRNRPRSCNRDILSVLTSSLWHPEHCRSHLSRGHPLCSQLHTFIDFPGWSKWKIQLLCSDLREIIPLL